MRLRLAPFVLSAFVAVAMPLLGARDASADGATALPLDQANTQAKKVQDFYDKTTSFSSDFTQEFYVKLHGIKKTSSGHVLFSKPGRMHWNYKEPEGNKVVSDGSVLKVYEASNKQMFQQANLTAAFVGPVPEQAALAKMLKWS